VLYWITSVGAAAARVHLGDTSLAAHTQAGRGSHEHRTWIQRCLTMYSVRTMILVIFEYPSSILQAQRTLLRVQDRISCTE
jgi:hypothetical protein